MDLICTFCRPAVVEKTDRLERRLDTGRCSGDWRQTDGGAYMQQQILLTPAMICFSLKSSDSLPGLKTTSCYFSFVQVYIQNSKSLFFYVSFEIRAEANSRQYCGQPSRGSHVQLEQPRERMLTWNSKPSQEERGN